MKLLKSGDPCPLCGQPIITTNQEALLVLSEIADLAKSQDAYVKQNRKIGGNDGTTDNAG